MNCSSHIGHPNNKQYDNIVQASHATETNDNNYFTNALLLQISAPAPANPESNHFSEIQPIPAQAKVLARFAGCQCSWSTFN